MTQAKTTSNIVEEIERLTGRPVRPEKRADGWSTPPMVEPPPGSPDDAFTLPLTGNCMFPDFQHGDRAVLSPSAKVRSGDPCLVWMVDGRRTFKRVYFSRGRKAIRLEYAHPKRTVLETVEMRNVKYLVKAVSRIRASEAIPTLRI